MPMLRYQNSDDDRSFYEGSFSEKSQQSIPEVPKHSMCKRFTSYFFGRPKDAEGPPTYQETRKYYPGKA